MKKIFIDCGYHLGEELTEFTNLLNIRSEFGILRKRIGGDTFKTINTLRVEWYDVDIESESLGTVADIVNKLHDINVHNWH